MSSSTRLPASTSVVVPFLLVQLLPAHGARADEHPVDCARGGDGLRIEYEIEDQIKERLYREQGAPLEVRGIEKRVLVLHGASSWQRETGKNWGTDWERVDKLYSQMEKEFEAAGTTTLRFHALQQELSQTKPITKLIDSIEVEVPHPGWSFSYDNTEKRGTKYVSSEDLSAQDAKRLTAAGVFGDLLAGRNPASEVEQAGTKAFAGHSCELSKAIRPARFEYCTTKIAGWEVDLYRRLSSPEGLAVVERAVAVDLDPCIAEGLFELPEGVDLIDR